MAAHSRASIAVRHNVMPIPLSDKINTVKQSPATLRVQMIENVCFMGVCFIIDTLISSSHYNMILFFLFQQDQFNPPLS